MPFLQVMSNRANSLFSFDNLGDFPTSTISLGDDLCALSQVLGIATSPAELSALANIPPALQQTIVGIVKYAVDHEDPADRIQVTFTWSPAYDYGLHIWEAHAIEGSPTAITVHLEGPYPDP